MSLARILKDPQLPGKIVALSETRVGPRGSPPKEIGLSVRTDRYRYTERRDAAGKLLGGELFDHQRDPGENQSLAGRKETREVQTKLQEMLRHSFDAKRERG